MPSLNDTTDNQEGKIPNRPIVHDRIAETIVIKVEVPDPDQSAKPAE
jgi:hypothetical protein